MRIPAHGWPARFNHIGPARAGAGLAGVLVTALGVAGCGTVTYSDAVGVGTTPSVDVDLAMGMDWSNPTPAKILMADFALAAPPTEFMVGHAYRLEIRNIASTGRSFVAPGFFRAIAVRQSVVSTGKPRLERVGFAADAMEALAYRAPEVIAAMLPPGFEVPAEPEAPANLEEMAAEKVIVAGAEPLDALVNAPEPRVLGEAEELALLAEWTAMAESFSAPGGLDLPASSSVFLTFVPLKAGTYVIGDGSRFAGFGARGTVTFVNLGYAARLPEAARPAADLALFIAEARDGLNAAPPAAIAPANNADAPADAPMPVPGADDPEPSESP